MAKKNQTQGKHRVTTTLLDDDVQRVEYWAARRGISINEYIHDAVIEKIKRENKDYDLPTMEIARLNQLIDAMTVLSTNVQSLESIVTSGFDSLIGLTRGDNYLLNHEDGEI